MGWEQVEGGQLGGCCRSPWTRTVARTRNRAPEAAGGPGSDMFGIVDSTAVTEGLEKGQAKVFRV